VDIPGGYGKAPVQPDRAMLYAGSWRITDYQGKPHVYEDS